MAVGEILGWLVEFGGAENYAKNFKEKEKW